MPKITAMFPAVDETANAPRAENADEICWAHCSGVFLMINRKEFAQFALGQLIALAIATILLAPIVMLVLPARATQDKSDNTGVLGAVANPADGAVTAKARPLGDTAKTIVADPQLIPRQFELIRAAVPGIARVGVLWQPDADDEQTKAMLQQAGKAAFATGLSVQFITASNPAQLETALSEISRAQVQAVIVTANPVLVWERKYIVNSIDKIRLPAMYPTREFAQYGGLMSYGPDLINVGRRGVKQENSVGSAVPTKFELVVNFNTALQLGITFNREFLMLVDEIIQ